MSQLQQLLRRLARIAAPPTGPAPLALVSSMPSNTYVGFSYGQPNVASGGTAPYTFSISSGVVPDGTFLNASTGLVNGTATTAGPFSYSVRVVDADGAFVVNAVSGSILSAVTGVTPNPANDIGGWTVPVPATRNLAASRLSAAQVGTRIYYIDSANGHDTAIGALGNTATKADVYFWNGTAIEDSTGSTNGSDGQPYGTDPRNPTGLVRAFKTWHFVGATIDGAEIGAGRLNVGNGAHYRNSGRNGRPDWWLFKRGTSIYLREDAAANGLAFGQMGTLNIWPSLSPVNKAYLGSYGPLTQAPAHFFHPGTEGYCFQNYADQSLYMLETENKIFQSIWLDGHDREVHLFPSHQTVYSGYAWTSAYIAGLGNVWEDIFFDGVRCNYATGLIWGALRVYGCRIGDVWNQDANYCVAFIGFSDQASVFDIQYNMLWRNGFLNDDKAMVWATSSSTIASFHYSTPHGLSVGDTHYTSGFAPAAYNVSGPVLSVPTATSLTVQMASAPGTDATTYGFWGSNKANPKRTWPPRDHMGKARSIYMNGHCDHMGSQFKYNASIQGGSGDQFRTGMRVEGNFFHQAYIGMGAKGGDDQPQSGTYKQNFLLAYTPGYGQGAPSWSHKLQSSARGVDFTDNIRSDAQYPTVKLEDTTFGFAQISPDQADVYYKPLEGCDVHDNISLSRAGSTTVTFLAVDGLHVGTDNGNGTVTYLASDGAGGTVSKLWGPYPGIGVNTIRDNFIVGLGLDGSTYYFKYPGATAPSPEGFDHTVYSNNKCRPDVATAAAEFGWPDVNRTIKTFVQSLGGTVTTPDGATELCAIWRQMWRGQFDFRFTGRSLANYHRAGFGRAPVS